jgi:malate dehydrogenase (oxaloacetate-decarboxylating)(NADP+)
MQQLSAPVPLPCSWTNGKVIFASGSPFDPITDAAGVTHYPAQANNAYIFPAVGMAAVLTKCSTITDEVFVVAAEALAEMAVMSDVAVGRLFPAFSNIRHVSKVLAAKVAEFIVASGLGEQPADCAHWERYVEHHMWHIAQTPSKI